MPAGMMEFVNLFLLFEHGVFQQFIQIFCSSGDLFALSITCRQMHVLVKSYVSKIIGDCDREYKLLLSCAKNHHVNHLYSILCISRVFIVGGYLDNRKFVAFDPATGCFHKRCGVGQKRTIESDLVFHQGWIFAISGRDAGSVGSVECFNMLTNDWKDGPLLPRLLTAASGASIFNELYIIGGCDNTTWKRSCSIYVLDQRAFTNGVMSGNFVFSTSAWTLCGTSLTAGRSHHASVAYMRKIWIAGGLLEGHAGVTNSVGLFDPTLQIVMVGASMVRARMRPRLLVIKDELYAVGGDIEGLTSIRESIEKYDPVLDQWGLVTEFPVKRTKSAVCALGNRIYVFGGRDGGQDHLTWDYFDVATNAWASERRAAPTCDNDEVCGCMALPHSTGLFGAMAIAVAMYPFT